MHYIINLDFDFSLFSLVVFGLLAWGAFRGYRLGGMIMGLSLFAMIGGFVVAGFLARQTYKYFIDKSLVPEVFGSIVLGVFFIGAIWFSTFIKKAVFSRLRDVNPDKTNNYIGLILGIIKYFIIVAVYATVILNLDCKGHFLPKRDRKSYSLNIPKIILTKSMKMIRMDAHRKEPCYPEDNIPQEIKGAPQPINNESKNTGSQTNTNENAIIEDASP